MSTVSDLREMNREVAGVLARYVDVEPGDRLALLIAMVVVGAVSNALSKEALLTVVGLCYEEAVEEEDNGKKYWQQG